MALPHQIIEFSDCFRPNGRAQVPIGSECGLDVLVAQALAHQKDWCVEMDEQGSVGVVEIVNSDVILPPSDLETFLVLLFNGCMMKNLLLTPEVRFIGQLKLYHGIRQKPDTKRFSNRKGE